MRIGSWAFPFTALVLTLSAAQALASVPYYVTDLGDLGGRNSEACDVNDSGQVVGRAECSGDYKHAFLWEQGSGMTDLGDLGGIYSWALGINDIGQVVGRAQNVDEEERAFLWQQGGGMVSLGTLGGDWSEARDINNSGRVVGRSGCSGPSYYYHAFLWEQGNGMVDLGDLGGTNSEACDINQSGLVVGWAENADHESRVFLWQQGSGMSDLGAGDAFAINDSGQVVGISSCHAFLWEPGTGMSDLGTLGGAWSWAYGISNNGQVVGEAQYSALPYTHAFLWQNGVMTDLNDLSFVDGANAGWVFGDAYAVNDRGQIVGCGGRDGYAHAFLLTPAPGLPAFALVGAAPLVRGLVRTLRRRSGYR